MSLTSPRAIALLLVVALGGCQASLTTFNANIEAPTPRRSLTGAHAECEAKISGSSTTRNLSIGGGATVTDEAYQTCLRRLNVDPFEVE